MASSQTPHYAWACGHVLLLLCTVIWLPSALRHPFSTPKTAYSYRLGYIGALASYGIVCFKALGTPAPNMAFLKRAMADENCQYFLLALYWLVTKPISLSLVPYAIFSTFHVLTFVRTTVLPKLAPPKPPAREGERQVKESQISRTRWGGK
ncbi:hypothetical protein RSAG8_07000, partial [Rhizoctonia solani AG-8 WAC10335]